MTEDPGLPILAPPNRTLSEHIADQLRQAILNHQLKPGQRIVEGQIAKAMDTSRGPVRDALLLLESEGIIIRYPRRGSFVARLSPQDAEEIYTLREAIESVALEYLIKHATPDQIGELDALVQKMLALAEQDYHPWDVTELDMEFHLTLCRLSGHSRVLDAWQSLRAQTWILLLRHQTRYPGDFAARGAEGHRLLVEAIHKRDLARAREVLQGHLEAVMDGMLNASQQEEA